MSNSLNEIFNRALGFHKQGQIPQAEALYLQVLQQSPGQPDALHFLGVIRYQQGRNLESENLICEALKRDPNNLMAMSNLGTTYSALGRFEDAKIQFSKVLEKQPKNFQVLTNRGNSHRELGQLDLAIDDYKTALNLNPHLYEATQYLGLCLQDNLQFEEARELLEYCVKVAPENPQAHLYLAHLYRRTNNLEAAVEHYQKTLKLGPVNARVQCNLAISLRDLGKLKKANYHFKKAIRQDPKLGRAWRGLSGLVEYKNIEQLTPMREALDEIQDDDEKMHLNFALGKAEEDLGQSAAAFSYFEKANELHAQTFEYEVEKDIAFFKKLQNIITADFIQKNKASSERTNKPIFVLGMPRSGTSLIEQILASHSNVFGAGELSGVSESIQKILPMQDDQDYSTNLSGVTSEDFDRIAAAYLEHLDKFVSSEAPFIVDKLPMNFIHIGIIALALPQAHIIHCRRNPMDNCLSIFKNYLPASGHKYSVNLTTLGQYYNGYSSLMRHWTNLFGDRIYHLDYELLVSDPETHTRALLEACNLEFEQACLTPQNTKRIVSTLSAAQVRKPINVKSIGGWRKYETELAPLAKVLGLSAT